MMDAFDLLKVKANRISYRVATVKDVFPPTRGPNATPLIMLLHGWPEGWYSWRHQLLALSAMGYPVCAPDMRGFGETDAPSNVRDYTVNKLCLDVVDITESLGFSKIIVIGHDFGSYLAWHLALLHPKRVVAVCGMSVPYLGHSPTHEPLLARLQRHFGTCLATLPYSTTRNKQEETKFHYILHHNLPNVEEDYDRNCREALYRLYSFKNHAADDDPPEVTDKLMFPVSCRKDDSDMTTLLDARSAPGLWARLPRPKSLPSWLSRDDFDYFVQQYRKSGFAGGLKWYQVMDINWYQTRHLRGIKIQQPSLYIIGEEDRTVLRNHGGLANVVQGMKENCTNLVDCVVIPHAGHWIQQECYERVNEVLLDFLGKVSAHERGVSAVSKL